MRNRTIVRLLSNGLSVFGLLIASVTGALLLFFVIVEAIAETQGPYTGLFTYLVLPPILLISLLIIPAGMLRKWRAMKRGEAPETRAWPLVDFNAPRTRRLFAGGLVGIVGYLGLMSVGSYKAFEYSESVTFCGRTCHSVMHPELTAYQHSPHARVTCVECHVGAGADWFVKSKISGSYQVYATLLDKYPRPIPTPIESLRPAQETCEQCHWPQMFFGAQQRQFNHYMYDEANTHWPINVLIRTGGGDPRTGQSTGIHWHMNIGNKVEYIARDGKRQDIPWVRMTDHLTGAVTVYQSKGEPLTEEEIASATVRVMDCMDCHNRPSHVFEPPDRVVDQALRTERISPSLPSIKMVAVEAMTQGYQTNEDARGGIATYITDHYRESDRETYEANREAIDQAILVTQELYSQNVLPTMGVDWKAYPNNIGHFYGPGCMRCHEGKHVSKDGSVITKERAACHALMAQGPSEGEHLVLSGEGLPFDHPGDVGSDWKKMGCWECHEGVQP